MRSRFAPLLAALFLSAPAFAPALAHDYKAGAVRIGHPFSRATPPGARVGAGYMTLENGGTVADRLVSASSPRAGAVEVHSSDMTDGVMRMRRVEGGLAIPAGATVTLAPGGGLHLMLMNLAEPLRAGERVPLELRFEHGGTVQTELAVEAMGGGADPHAGH